MAFHKNLADCVSLSLEWRRPTPLQRAYVLCAGTDVLATLRWLKPSGSLALAESAAGSWTLKRTGFLTPHVTVRTVGAHANLALFKIRWSGDGELHFIDGPHYLWARRESPEDGWEFATPFLEPILDVRPLLPSVSPDHAVENVPVASLRAKLSIPEPQLTLLAVLGWYVLVLMADDAAINTGAV